MANIRYLLLSFSLLVFIRISDAQGCTSLHEQFSSYQNAIQKITAAKWKITESKYTPESSWVRKISYFSCDGEKGYLIVVTDQNQLVHSVVPKYLWNQFKEAPSKGSFYNRYLKGRYPLSVQ